MGRVGPYRKRNHVNKVSIKNIHGVYIRCGRWQEKKIYGNGLYTDRDQVRMLIWKEIDTHIFTIFNFEHHSVMDLDP